MAIGLVSLVYNPPIEFYILRICGRDFDFKAALVDFGSYRKYLIGWGGGSCKKAPV
ncbi:MAG TPA: hypothetical protein VF303_01425 [Candidatus Nanoarchaeia archaeon]